MKRGNIPKKDSNKAGADQACHRLISMALRIAWRVGRGCKRRLLQSWHLMCAVNIGAEKWNDMLKVQQLDDNGDVPTSSHHCFLSHSYSSQIFMKYLLCASCCSRHWRRQWSTE